MNILLSAGHHSQKKGVSFEGFNEHDEAIEWVKILNEILGEDSTIVPFMTLPHKVQFINTNKATMAIEIHFNSAQVENDAGELVHVGRGSETLYYPKSVTGKKNALIMQEHLSNVFSPDRGAKEGYYQTNPAKGADYFLRKTKCPSLIIEPEFIHKKSDIIEKRQAGCEAIAKAIRIITKDL